MLLRHASLVKAFDVSKGDMVLQKKAFLASEAGVELSVFFNKRVGSGLFGGEGFIMQRLSGKGIAFAEFDGHVIEYDLEAGQQLVVDTGHLAAMSASCKMEIRSVPGVKNMLFGGEGIRLFMAPVKYGFRLCQSVIWPVR